MYFKINHILFYLKYVVPFTPVVTTTLSTNTAEAQIGDTTQTNATSSFNSNYLYLLFLLLIPLMIFVLLVFCCCCGRCCQVFTHNKCNLLLCPCSRPKDSYADNGKSYDATICYSEYDENWIDEQFLPCMSQFENNYRIHKLSLYNRSSDKISRENEKVLRSSKRIILIFSRKFLKEEWSNRFVFFISHLWKANIEYVKGLFEHIQYFSENVLGCFIEFHFCRIFYAQL